MLLHPTSLPGGRLGAPAQRFVDFLADCGFGVWQMLPLGPLGIGSSPYMSPSAFAGGEHLVARTEDEGAASGNAGSREDRERFADENRGWLEDWCLFKALKDQHRGRPWWRWPAALRDRDREALARAARELAAPIAIERSTQFRFASQWRELRTHARERGVALVGDMPMYVAADSADVWSRPDLFALGADGRAERIAGVPPDYFAATGQRWGNPIYDWPRHAAEGYRWWISRVMHALGSFDRVRIDHFRGFAAYWSIPADAETAIDGRWEPGPGDALFAALADAIGPLPIIAEDLGMIDRSVHDLRDRLGFPGMRVLEFAFDGDPANLHLPEHHVPECVAYSATHDNDTLRGWLASAAPAMRAAIRNRLGCDDAGACDALLDALWGSRARLAIAPLQDLLGLGSEARMNTPGTVRGNWRWRLAEHALRGELAARIRAALATHGRLPERPPAEHDQG